MNIIFIGAQGSGKGTQAGKLSTSLSVPHISSGDLFRSAMEKKTPLGLQAKQYLDKGELVPDHLTIDLVLERMKQRDCLSGFLLDGFPRTIAQAQALDTRFARMRKTIDHVLYLNVPREELLRRLSHRLICRAHQHVYNAVTQPPLVPGICDIDKSELYQRLDDTTEALQKRLDIFFRETLQLLDYYDAQQKLITIDGGQDIDQVYLDILRMVTFCGEESSSYCSPLSNARAIG